MTNDPTASSSTPLDAVVAAELARMGQRAVKIPAAEWEAFEAWIAQPPRPSSALVELFRRSPACADDPTK